MALQLVAICAVLAATAAEAPSAKTHLAKTPSLEFRSTGDPLRPRVMVSLPSSADGSAARERADQPAQVFTLHRVEDAAGTLGPAIFARYGQDDGAMWLAPRYPLAAGSTYRAVCYLPEGGTLEATYEAGDATLPELAEVERVYPSGNVLPANLLKFYVHFSQPMSKGGALFDAIQLLDSAGQPIEGPWWQSELWSTDTRRLTLLVHPGRIKQGVNLREEAGPVLEPGGQYTLRVLADVRDAHGRPLARPWEKTFRVVAEDHTQPQPEQWHITTPHRGTTEAFILALGEPLDRWLLERYVRVVDAAGAEVPGSVQVSDEERRWSFLPEQVWREAEYAVEVNPWLEDLAGNTPGRVFDTDLQSQSAAGADDSEPAVIRVPFVPVAVE